MLIVSRTILNDLFEHAKDAYPEECCGILVGRDTGAARTITESHRAQNVSEERRHERYLIDERKIIEVTNNTRNRSVDIIGFYHSHPNYPSRPSSYDTETAAWPGYSYLIVSLQQDSVVSFQSWVIPEDGKSFVEEPVQVDEAVEP